MNDELAALKSNHTWEITDLPPSKQAIGCKWLYKTKLHADGSLDKHKSRLVILGNHRRPGEDYTQTFSPVAKMITMRSLLAVVAINYWTVHQMDVKNAFLQGDHDEVVYMKLPPGYTLQSQGESHTSLTSISSPKVCKLLKSLNGLKQAPRQWFFKLSTTLQSF